MVAFCFVFVGRGVFQVCLGWLFLWAYWFADFGGLAYCDTSGFGPRLLRCYGLDGLVGLMGCVVLVLALRVGILGLLLCVAVWLCILLLGLSVVGWLVLGVWVRWFLVYELGGFVWATVLQILVALCLVVGFLNGGFWI